MLVVYLSIHVGIVYIIECRRFNRILLAWPSLWQIYTILALIIECIFNRTLKWHHAFASTAAVFDLCRPYWNDLCVRMLERDRDAVTYSQNCKFPSQVCKHSLSVRMSELVLVQSWASSFIEVMKALWELIYCMVVYTYFLSGNSVTVTLRFVLTVRVEFLNPVLYSHCGSHVRRWKFVRINNVLVCRLFSKLFLMSNGQTAAPCFFRGFSACACFSSHKFNFCHTVSQYERLYHSSWHFWS